MKPLFPPTDNSKRTENDKTSPVALELRPESILNSSMNSWKLIRLELEKEYPHTELKNTLASLSVRQNQPDEIILELSCEKAYLKITTDYLDKINHCKNKIGLSFIAISVCLKKKQSAEAEILSETPKPADASSVSVLNHTELTPTKTATDLFTQKLRRVSKLNPTYTFDTFVRGPSNQFALATCLGVGDNPGTNYNPLFLYGSTGLGKTHLLHAVGNSVVSNHPNMVITYISSERFMNEMIHCIRHNKMWDFRQKYRHCDLFLMDDIQFISGNKSATQEEFFHTFNTLYEAKKQIIVTSDLFPEEIPDIEERLRNRFKWGLIADIQPPDMEHRIAILINKAEQLGIRLSTEVAEYIAKHAKKNVRELEGALHRLTAFAALHGRPVNMSLAVETFQNMGADSPKRLEINTVQKIAAEHFSLRLVDLKSKKRQHSLTLPRQIAMYLARSFTNASYPDIGLQFGGKDHTTVMYAVKKITAKRKDPDIKSHLEALERKLDQAR